MLMVSKCLMVFEVFDVLMFLKCYDQNLLHCRLYDKMRNVLRLYDFTTLRLYDFTTLRLCDFTINDK